MIHQKNCFVTLTYNDDHLGDGRLNYTHFQKFMKNLRNKEFRKLLDSIFPNVPKRLQTRLWNKFPKERRDALYEPKKISVFVTGEYGEQTKRPHWHACIFNYEPSDGQYFRTSERGDRIYRSTELTELWGKGNTEFGTVTLQSAGYCARYAAKKLVHGRDQDHDYHPISKKSSHQAIGKRWLVKNWPDIFNHGKCLIMDSTGEVHQTTIPRYYEKWLKENEPQAWLRYVTEIKIPQMAKATKQEEDYKLELLEHNLSTGRHIIPRAKVRKSILQAKFKRLMSHLKGDI